MQEGCDRALRIVIAHAVPFSGADVSWTAALVCRDPKRFGHCGHVTSRSDLAPVVVSFMQDVSSMRGSLGTVL